MDPLYALYASVTVFLVVWAATAKHVGNTRRLRARHALFEARDDLIGLVATGVIDEDGNVFKYICPRISLFIEEGDGMGVDRIFELFSKLSPSHLRNAPDFFEKERQELQAVILDRNFKHPAVAPVVFQCLYRIGSAVQANSNFVRLAGVLLRSPLARKLLFRLLPHVSGSWRRSIELLEFLQKLPTDLGAHSPHPAF